MAGASESAESKKPRTALARAASPSFPPPERFLPAASLARRRASSPSLSSSSSDMISYVWPIKSPPKVRVRYTSSSGSSPSKTPTPKASPRSGRVDPNPRGSSFARLARACATLRNSSAPSNGSYPTPCRLVFGWRTYRGVSSTRAVVDAPHRLLRRPCPPFSSLHSSLSSSPPAPLSSRAPLRPMPLPRLQPISRRSLAPTGSEVGTTRSEGTGPGIIAGPITLRRPPSPVASLAAIARCALSSAAVPNVS